MTTHTHDETSTEPGRTFASRRAAQWAVFFDTLGIRWRGRPALFLLPGGRLYRPDFWLPDFRVWIEVRPDGPLGPHSVGAAAALARATRDVVYIFAGDVWPAAQRATHSPAGCAPRLDPVTGAWTVLAFPDAAWTECPTCGAVSIPHDRERPGPPPAAELRGATVPLQPRYAELARCDCPATRLLAPDLIAHYGTTPRLLAAYAAAAEYGRQAPDAGRPPPDEGRRGTGGGRRAGRKRKSADSGRQAPDDEGSRV